MRRACHKLVNMVYNLMPKGLHRLMRCPCNMRGDQQIRSVQILHLDKESIGPDIDFVLPQTDHLWTSYDHTPAELVIPRLADADIVVLNKVQITCAHLQALPKLKYIVLTATGFDKIDIQACHEHNVTVSNARGYARHTVTEHTIALIFALRRSLAGNSAPL